jgi:16S rRNA (cytosine967-C5)-methyltransferase
LQTQRLAPPSARNTAFRALERVLYKSEFAAAALDDELGRGGGLQSNDRALATELTYGVLRTKAALEERLASLAPRGVAKDAVVLLRLLIAAYEISFLDRIPNFASVNEAVNAVREVRGPKVGGFCNAVLRRYLQLPTLTLDDAILASVPAWLSSAVNAAVDEHEARLLLGASARSEEQHEAPSRAVSGTTIRFRQGVAIPEWASAASPGALYSGAYRFTTPGDLRRHPEFGAGAFVIQDEGSMFAAAALGARPGERVLDVCAGRGHKASLIAEQLGRDGGLWVTDNARRKLDQLLNEFQRLQLPLPQNTQIDWSQPCSLLPKDFDRVLVDAPCTGTGTLRRRPEIALRLQPADVERLATLAETILRNAAHHVRSGGRVLFVVCSVLPRETQDVVNRVSDVLESVPFETAHPALAPETTSIHLLPGAHGSDGFFIASLRAKST